MPVFVPVLAGIAGSTVVRYAVAGTVTYFVGKEVVASVNEDAGETVDDIEDAIIGAGGTILSGAATELGSLSLTFVEGFGSAVITGIERAYDTVREKLRGKEDDVIAGFTVGFLAILTIVFLYQSAKKGGA
jgi:hypothetical protein